ncbi:E3 ubiquitin-protein ligase TRIM56-like [Patiria miniata]|uniref:TRIM56 n=1 Tax=Patiria miniata TaxID=46514 RepID=A0A913YXQ4_PATMI|nr:E3 ubiquitin-protein ligase TRIM56-like [Patiria miniata]
MATGTALTTSPDQMGKNNLICSICQSRYREPKILDCLHSFCESCLEKYYFNKHEGAARIPCPECQQEMQVPDQGIQGLTTNCYLSGKVETSLQEKVENARSFTGESEVPLCEICDDENEAVNICWNCEQMICSNCKKIHARIATSSSHTVSTLEEIHQGKVALLKSEDHGSCRQHSGKERNFYCETCEEFICQDCTIKDHSKPQHNYFDSVTASVKCRQSLKDLFPAVARHIDGLERSSVITSQDKQEITNNIENTIQDVKDRAAMVRNAILTQENELIDQIRLAENNHYKPLNRHERTVTMMMQRARYSLDTATKFESAATDSQLLTLFPTFRKSIQSLANEKPPQTDHNFHQRCALKFKQSDQINIGKLHPDVLWELWDEFTEFHEGGLLGRIKLKSACGIVATQVDEIAVAEFHPNILPLQQSTSQVIIFNIEGKHKRTIKSTIDNASKHLGIAAARNQLVIADGTSNVKIHNRDNEVVSVSVAVRNDGNIVVGDIKRKVLTEHNANNCSVIRTIPLEIAPSYLAVDVDDSRSLPISRESNPVSAGVVAAHYPEGNFCHTRCTHVINAERVRKLNI